MKQEGESNSKMKVLSRAVIKKRGKVKDSHNIKML